MNLLTRFMSILGQRGDRIGSLLQTSLTIMSGKINVISPILLLFIVKLAEYGIYLALLYHSFVSKDYDLVFNLAVALFFILPGRMLFETFVQAYIAKRTHDALCQKPSTLIQVLGSLLLRSFKLIAIGLISALVRKISEHQGNGIMGFLAALIAFAIKEVWDLVSNFGIAAIVIDDQSGKSFKQKLLELKSHISEVLVGVIGIDLMAGVVMSIFGGGAFFAVFGGGALGYFYSDRFPTSMLTQFGEASVNTFPFFLILIISFTFCALVSAVGQATKSVYFTIFYSALNHAEDISSEHQTVVKNMLTNTHNELALN